MIWGCFLHISSVNNGSSVCACKGFVIVRSEYQVSQLAVEGSDTRLSQSRSRVESSHGESSQWRLRQLFFGVSFSPAAVRSTSGAVLPVLNWNQRIIRRSYIGSLTTKTWAGSRSTRKRWASRFSVKVSLCENRYEGEIFTIFIIAYLQNAKNVTGGEGETVYFGAL